jgi:hypothetical protein
MKKPAALAVFAWITI